jgi:hypothetical protein
MVSDVVRHRARGETSARQQRRLGPTFDAMAPSGRRRIGIDHLDAGDRGPLDDHGARVLLQELDGPIVGQ